MSGPGAAPVLSAAPPTVDAALTAAAAQYGDVLAFVDGDRRVTYAEWDRAAAGTARALADAGARAGAVVCLMLPSSLDFAVAFAAAARLGAVVTAVNPRLGPVETEAILARCDPAVLVGNDPRWDGSTPTATTRLSVADVASAADGRPVPPAVDGRGADDAAVIGWTSGTTGLPKGAWFSHRSLEAAVRLSGVLSGPYDRRLLSTPFAHVGFLTRVWDQVAWAMTGVLTPPVWTADSMLDLLQRERVTVGQGVPTQWEKVLALPALDDADLSALRVIGTGAARVPPELVLALRKRLGCPVVVRYACTEVPIATGTDPDDPVEVVAGTIGQPATGVDVRLVDESDSPTPAGGVGRVQLRSPGAMGGYWCDAEQTADALAPEGWIRTSDLARRTERGDLVIVGRTSEVYVRGGYNVYPLEVERALLDHPGVAQAAVVGVEAPVLGELGVAYVVPSDPGPPPQLADLRAWCQARLADYKAPDRLEVVADLPLNSMMKIDKRRLRAAPTSGP